MPAPVYTPAPTKADAMGPVVPPVYMRLLAREGATLQRATDDGWTEVCEAPCNGWVPAFGAYRVLSPGGERSQDFTLPGPPGTCVALEVNDDGTVMTRDSVQLAARRAQGSATAATWLALGAFVRK